MEEKKSNFLWLCTSRKVWGRSLENDFKDNKTILPSPLPGPLVSSHLNSLLFLSCLFAFLMLQPYNTRLCRTLRPLNSVRPSPSKTPFLSETFFSLRTLSRQISSQLDLFVVSPGTWRQFDGLAGSSRPGLWSFACVRYSQGMLCMPSPSFSQPEVFFIDCFCLHRCICSLKQSDPFWQFNAKYNYSFSSLQFI